MTWLLAPLLSGFSLYYVMVIRRMGLFTADSLFVYLQLLMAVGSIPLLDQRYPADRIYGYILGYTALCYMLISGITQLSWPLIERRSTANPVIVYQPSRRFWILLFIAMIVIVLYYQSVGYSALARGLSDTLSGRQSDIAGLRLDSYSGSRYLFPGYVNQFKNALLPALVVLALTYAMRARKGRVIAVLLACFTAFTLVGTGQRSAFVIFMATVVVYLYLMNGSRLPKGRLILLALVFFPIIILTTVALGRSDKSLGTNAGITLQSETALSDFKDRVLVSNQMSGVAGFRYIYLHTQVQDGQEWLRQAEGILPGSRGSTLANEIFASLYGDDRGTSPPSIWGSIYHNFGTGGIVVAPILLALVIARVSRAGVLPHTRNSMEVIGIAGVFTTFGTWIIGGPVFLLNGGLVVYAALWLRGRRSSRRAEQAASEQVVLPERFTVDAGQLTPLGSGRYRSSEP